MGSPGGFFAAGLLVILLVAAIPYLVSLQRVMSAINSIRDHIDGILEHGVVLTGELDGVPELLEVTDSVRLRVLKSSISEVRSRGEPVKEEAVTR